MNAPLTPEYRMSGLSQAARKLNTGAGYQSTVASIGKRADRTPFSPAPAAAAPRPALPKAATPKPAATGSTVAPTISEADLASARALVAAGEVRREKERQAQLAVIAAGKVRRAKEREASIAASWKKVIATMNARTAPRRLHR
jgi:Tfp pilus assembly protein FimV